jgi:hypothetical protein
MAIAAATPDCTSDTASPVLHRLCDCEQTPPGIWSYAQRYHMKSEPRPPVVRSFTGNCEERAAQIARITERIERLGGNPHQVAAELATLAREIKTLHNTEAAPLGNPNDGKLSH